MFVCHCHWYATFGNLLGNESYCIAGKGNLFWVNFNQSKVSNCLGHFRHQEFEIYFLNIFLEDAMLKNM